MVCIYCSTETQVTNSRPQKRLNQVWRRRSCNGCKAMFTTNELIDMSTSIVVKHSDGHITAFSRDKLFLSLLRAVGHRAQPINDAGALVATVMTKLHPKAVDAAIAAHDIVKTTYDTLRHFDTAAAVQYRAYHKS